jgi:hypothetical protein
VSALRLNAVIARSAWMTDTIQSLHKRMEDAAAALDFEEARRCRDMIALIRSGSTTTEAEQAASAGLERQQPGAMGLGTSRQGTTPPADWRPPPKPDPMTAGRSARSRRRKP